MRKELEQKLVERWPAGFNTGGVRDIAMPLGWFRVIQLGAKIYF